MDKRNLEKWAVEAVEEHLNFYENWSYYEEENKNGNLKDLKNFPYEVVFYMLYYQLEQGNCMDFDVFDKNKNANAKNGGFDWDKTREGLRFCYDVINDEKFEVFFERYPRQVQKV